MTNSCPMDLLYCIYVTDTPGWDCGISILLSFQSVCDSPYCIMASIANTMSLHWFLANLVAFAGSGEYLSAAIDRLSTRTVTVGLHTDLFMPAEKRVAKSVVLVHGRTNRCDN